MPIRWRALAVVAMVVAMAACDVAGRQEGPGARGGLMDLSRWDLETQGPVALRGEWVFRWGELLGPTALRAGDTPAPPLITVPRAWNEVLREGAPLGGEGFATLRRADRALYAGKAAGRNQVTVAQRDDVETTAAKTREARRP